MTSPWLLIIAIVLLGATYVVLPVFVRAYVRYRGRRVITCPETKEAAAVVVDARRVAVASLVGPALPRLKDCTRWPEREKCGQECLAQIEEAPDGCLVESMVRSWYAGKSCSMCKRPIGTIHWFDQPPALRDSAGRTMTWTEVHAEDLPKVFATHAPVCWSCHTAEAFRREHGDLVVERPWKDQTPGGKGPKPTDTAAH